MKHKASLLYLFTSPNILYASSFETRNNFSTISEQNTIIFLCLDLDLLHSIIFLSKKRKKGKKNLTILILLEILKCT